MLASKRKRRNDEEISQLMFDFRGRPRLKMKKPSDHQGELTRLTKTPVFLTLLEAQGIPPSYHRDAAGTEREVQASEPPGFLSFILSVSYATRQIRGSPATCHAI